MLVERAGGTAEDDLADRIGAEGSRLRDATGRVDFDDPGNAVDAIGVEERIVSLRNDAVKPELSCLGLDAIDATAAHHGQRQLLGALTLSPGDHFECRRAGTAAGIGEHKGYRRAEREQRVERDPLTAEIRAAEVGSGFPGSEWRRHRGPLHLETLEQPAVLSQQLPAEPHEARD